MSEPMMEMHGLSRSFGGKPAVRGVDLIVPRGSVYGLLGRNGAGKSTLLRMMAGLVRPDGGTIRVRGVEPALFTVADRQRIGYVPERPVFPGLMRVKSLVRFCAAFQPDWDTALVDRTLDRYRIDPEARIKTLSQGGLRQVSLTLAFAQRPDLLLLDEPAGGLDVVARRELLDAIVELLQDDGKTVVFSSHILTDVERVADTIGIMVDGRLTVSEPLDSLKETVKQVRVFGGTSDAATLEPPGTLRVRRSGGEVLATVRLQDEGALRQWAEARGCEYEVRDLGLEDIFVELAGEDGR